jgi:L-gulonolactone oxidase
VFARFRRERRSIGTAEEIFHSKIRLRKRVLEHAIPARHATAALHAIDRWCARNAPPARLPIEVRFGAADDIWLSPSRGRDVCYIGAMMTAASDPAIVERYFRAVESILAGYDSRPHWAKVTYRGAAELAKTYPEWSRFLTVRNELDPAGTFGNAFLDRVLGPRE